MEIIPFQPEFLPQAAAFFTASFNRLRSQAPALPERMADPRLIAEKLAWLFGFCPGAAALDADGRLLGFLGWFVVDGFRNTTRRAAYCPEWGHAVVEGRAAEVYRALYRAASTHWAADGCQAHAITLLGGDEAALRTWFWNGFGMLVVDAVRPMQPLGIENTGGLCIRRAIPEDAQMLSLLEAEYCRHYAQTPLMMVPGAQQSAAEFADFISRPRNSVWLTLDGDTPVGFLRFDGYDFDGVEVISADDTVSINAAYVRPAYRGRRAAQLLLDAGLRHYAGEGMRRCALNFESFNPEAAAFWPRFFTPVCYSLMRVPEVQAVI